jgi:hypothetical protein
MSRYRTAPTPNPNSLKLTRADGTPFKVDGMLAANSIAEAQSSPLGSALFEIAGVTNILVMPPFATLSKAPHADWNDILPRAEQVLDELG